MGATEYEAHDFGSSRDSFGHSSDFAAHDHQELPDQSLNMSAEKANDAPFSKAEIDSLGCKFANWKDSAKRALYQSSPRRGAVHDIREDIRLSDVQRADLNLILNEVRQIPHFANVFVEE